MGGHGRLALPDRYGVGLEHNVPRVLACREVAWVGAGERVVEACCEGPHVHRWAGGAEVHDLLVRDEVWFACGCSGLGQAAEAGEVERLGEAEIGEFYASRGGR